MRFNVLITIQFGDGPEAAVFHSDQVTPETMSSTLAIAERSVRGVVSISQAGRRARMREYLGPALLKEEELLAA